MRAGTKATCCWLSAVQSQSCCVQTCWLLSAADFTDAVMGHREVSKGRRQFQIIHHDQETRGEIHQLNAASLAKVDLIRYCCSLHVFDRPLYVFQPICLRVSLTLCVLCRQTWGHEICSACIRVNQPTLALQSTTPLGSWSERLGRRDSCVVDTQTSPTTYPLFSEASRR